MSRCLLIALIVLLARPALSQGLGGQEIRSESVGDGLHVIFGPGAGNMLVSIGDDGVVMVDNGVPDIVDGYKAKIAELGGGEVDIAINTHWHYDHADGNKVLGPEGVRLVSHQNSRAMMMVDNIINTGTRTIDQPAYAPDAWPTVTYQESMHLYFNGDEMLLLHPGPGHTNGDTAVIFPERNLVHMGDVFITFGYPFVDADHGGSLIGIAEFCERVLDELEPGATVIPGHGQITSYEALTDYAAMLRTIAERITTLVEDGASLEQVIAAAPTSEWDDAVGDPAALLERTYASLTR